MKVVAIILTLVFIFGIASFLRSAPRAGLYLPDSIHNVTLKYRTYNGLILLPVVINDNIHVNLILDTGCRNLVLFGKRFEKLFSQIPGRKVEFSGLGNGQSIAGGLALNNKVSIDAVLGESIPVVIIPDRNFFNSYPSVHGIIGYEVFSRFEIELDPKLNLISFRPGASSELPPDYARIALRVEDSRPILSAVIEFSEGTSLKVDLMIDTGSTLGLLIKTNSVKTKSDNIVVIGRGLNGLLEGIQKESRSLHLESMSMPINYSNVVESKWNTHSSIGMEVLNGYSIILNYSKSYAGLKKQG